MAFKFNWSPLTADAGFYTRAQELLTAALNKSPKPPIIVDDILVNELNLGHAPPELEILEIGDLAEDRFRGIFKMSYSGDAFLTLKTRVQANPLNTYLLTRPSFASPQPLAAATGLTIPLQITLSDIKLSGFIILVFSRQKGLTLVFRNDPLESLKVSSTFDSIPFVANYLQKEIEAQLRILLMDELPAIIHRLSLRLWVPEYKAREERELAVTQQSEEEPVVDPLASPPQDPVDAAGNVLTAAEIASLSLDSSVETQSLFSRKNLLRLATLTNSHRTLSLFTPPIRDVVFRAWAAPMERGEFTGFHTPAVTPALSRTHSYAGSLSTTYTFESGSQARPGLSFGSGLNMGSSRQTKTHGGRKRKKRVVNLRKQAETGEIEVISEDGSNFTDSASVTESNSSAPSVFSAPPAISSPEHHGMSEPMTPPVSPSTAHSRYGKAVDRAASATAGHTERNLRRTPGRSATLNGSGMEHASGSNQTINQDQTVRWRHRSSPALADLDATPRASMYLPERRELSHSSSSTQLQQAVADSTQSSSPTPQSSAAAARGTLPNFLQFIADPTNGGSIAERAWMVKIAGEVAKRYEEEREKGLFGSKDEDPPPPAYAQ